MKCPKCLVHMDNHIDQVGMSHLWKKVQDEIVHQRTFTKKAPIFCVAPCRRYQDTIHILQHPKLPRNTVGFNNRNLSHKTLKDGALPSQVFNMVDPGFQLSLGPSLDSEGKGLSRVWP